MTLDEILSNGLPLNRNREFYMGASALLLAEVRRLRGVGAVEPARVLSREEGVARGRVAAPVQAGEAAPEYRPIPEDEGVCFPCISADHAECFGGCGCERRGHAVEYTLVEVVSAAAVAPINNDKGE